MAITNRYKRISLEQIEVRREARQRREVDVSDLTPSIRKRGVISPIIVEEIAEDRYLLLAGERRYTASKEVGLKDIPARLASDLSYVERQIYELEENVKRKDLDWKEEVIAIKLIHTLYKTENPSQTHEETAEAIGYSRGIVSIMIRVAEEVEAGNKLVLATGGFRPAYNILSRNEERRIDNAMNDLLEEPTVVAPKGVTVNTKPGGITTIPIHSKPSDFQVIVPIESIQCEDFLKWAPLYQGRPFSFLHCDFPYGINIDKSEQSNIATFGTYTDTDETYWTLCQCLADNLDALMTQSGHLLFWTSSDIRRQHATLEFFAKHAPSLDFIPVPLLWHKTDNKGILPDPKRGPRRVFESALMASRGDRLIIKAVSNVYGAPTSKEVHQSEKPEPMLRHFFSMFVDENTRMLDPTCGSGTSLRAAESLGASAVLGLELNTEFIEPARTLLRKSRNLRKLNEATKHREKSDGDKSTDNRGENHPRT